MAKGACAFVEQLKAEYGLVRLREGMLFEWEGRAYAGYMSLLRVVELFEKQKHALPTRDRLSVQVSLAKAEQECTAMKLLVVERTFEQF